MSSLATPAALLGAGPESLFDVAEAISAQGRFPDPAITQAARAAAPAAASVSGDRVRAALEAILLNRHLDLGLQWLHESGVLAQVLPEIDATVNFSQEA